jgi:hypothetical protein
MAQKHLAFFPSSKTPGSSISSSYAYNFLARHPEIEAKTPSTLDLPRTIAAMQAVLSPWFDLLNHTLLTYDISPGLFFQL